MTLVGIHGGLSVDHLVTEPAGARFSCPGGPALFAALGARLVSGTDVRVSCPLPGDAPEFARIFDDLGVDRRYCHPVPTVPRLWILNSARGRRIVTQDTTARTELEGPDPVGPGSHDSLPAPAAGFQDGLDGLVASSPAERPEADPKTRVGLDPHQALVAEQGLEHLRRVVSATTVLLPSRIQLSLLDSDPRRAARSLAAGLGLPVVARLDAEGSYVVTADGNWSVRDRAATVVETTGAGDASAGAVVAALAAGADPVEAALYGTSIARTALADWGHEALAAAAPIACPFPGITTRKEH
ncbi:PfkB family carbohydrate kinase [Streptomyces sp. NBC_00038]|uniref:PfkB family carbohydrate kinase n=1 Tax=Streptomyces sp. NBC_00038 TaxID=2903615 RepID=UPI0022569199|nr:PfkB family carbohydrate kinase [Streptomyces sp. NBC_00038]MCX5554466.1 PfkB family carbohydrate kinase [Streptomyces sp. NBC_00038]